MTRLDWNVLDLDYEQEATRICARLREILARTLHRRGLVVAISGGIDSSTCLGAGGARAGRRTSVYALILPERDSSDDSAARAAHPRRTPRACARRPTTSSRRWPRSAATSSATPRCAARCPATGHGWRFKIVIAGGRDGGINYFRLVAKSPDGADHDVPLPLGRVPAAIVAATNFKQRIRKKLEYFHADRLNYAVTGTPNRLEYDQGFFVKNGDGAADVKPIAHLYKSQVYGMARHLGLPERVCAAVPTTDTYSLAQGQDEFYFALPYRSMDLALWALNHEVPAAELARVLDIGVAAAEAVYADIRAKRRTTRYLHLAAGAGGRRAGAGPASVSDDPPLPPYVVEAGDVTRDRETVLAVWRGNLGDAVADGNQVRLVLPRLSLRRTAVVHPAPPRRAAPRWAWRRPGRAACRPAAARCAPACWSTWRCCRNTAAWDPRWSCSRD